MEIRKYGRHWAVFEEGKLICITLYKKGAEEVVRKIKEARKVKVKK